MMSLVKKAVVLLLLPFFLAAVTTTAAFSEEPKSGEAFAVPTFKEVSQSIVLLGGLDINDPKVADEYSQLMYCNLFREKYRSDFEWNEVRRQILTRVKNNREYYRVLYEISGILYLGRYNFETQDFPFVRESALNNIGSMLLLDQSSFTPYCNRKDQSGLFTAIVLFNLNQPLTFDRLKIPMDEAEALIELMLKEKNDLRQIYARFRFRADAAERIDVNRGGLLSRSSLRGDIVAIDVFLDKELTKFLVNVPVN